MALIARACADAGRDPAEVAIRCSLSARRDDAGKPDLAGTLAAAEAFVAAGATVIQLPALASFITDVGEIPAFVAEAARTIHAIG